jgi:hypothetical protein
VGSPDAELQGNIVMAQESPAAGPTLQEVHAHLEAISELLRRPHRLDAAARAALADLVDELDKALKLGKIPNEQAVRLAATASHFAEAVHSEEEAGVLKAARARLEEAAVAAENNAPMVAGLARRFMDALSNIGI